MTPTEIVAVDAGQPDAEVIARAAELIRQGRLVAFPTETVYGLGASALDADAVARIFAAKGRPATNPVIVHVGNLAEVDQVAADWPDAARRLAERFWPGPLTLVVPRRPAVPAIVTAGGATVAVRMPAHPVALALLRAAGLPIAAPSANRSSRLSPTRAEHVRRDLEGRVDLILDAGPTPGGIESTVVHLGVVPPRLLRPGLLTAAELEEVIGPIARGAQETPADRPLPSPGLLKRHYAPNTPLRLVEGDGLPVVQELLAQGGRVGWLRFHTGEMIEADRLEVVTLPGEPGAYAAQLFAVLHELDRRKLDAIVVELPPADEAWLAVRDRLQRAAVPG